MRPCPACSRHVRDATCPFCGAAVPAAAPRPAFTGRITRAAVFSAVAGCWTGPTAPDVKHADDTQHTHEPQGSGAAAGSIEGVVTDSVTGEPVAEATVRVVNTTIEGKTDGLGHYALTGLAPGTYTVVVFGGSRNPRLVGAQAQVTVTVGAAGARGDVSIDVPQARHPGGGIGPNGTPMPYGAPPARKRVV